MKFNKTALIAAGLVGLATTITCSIVACNKKKIANKKQKRLDAEYASYIHDIYRNQAALEKAHNEKKVSDADYAIGKTLNQQKILAATDKFKAKSYKNAIIR